MNTKKEVHLKRQKIAIKIFWTTVFFLLGFLFAVWQTYELAHEDVLVDVSPAMNFILFILAVEFIFVVIMLISTRRHEKTNFDNYLQHIEKLGKLKEQGLITEDEFEKEKKKLLDRD